MLQLGQHANDTTSIYGAKPNSLKGDNPNLDQSDLGPAVTAFAACSSRLSDWGSIVVRHKVAFAATLVQPASMGRCYLKEFRA